MWHNAIAFRNSYSSIPRLRRRAPASDPERFLKLWLLALQALLAAMRSREVDEGSKRDDAGRIDVTMALIIMALDMREIHCGCDLRPLVELARIAEDVRVIDDPREIAFEVTVINTVEADERRE